MNESMNLLLPRVENFRQEKSNKQDCDKPKKRGQISKGRCKKKTQKTLNRYDTISDHKGQSNTSVGDNKRRASLSIGLPNVLSKSPNEACQDEQQEKSNQFNLPQILKQNLWGRREKAKKEKVQLGIEGNDLALPPPKPQTKPRRKDGGNEVKILVVENFPEEENSKDATGGEARKLMPNEVSDIKKILHCHIVGMPVEIRKVTDDDMQVARPIFHCQTCLDEWLRSGVIRENCTEAEKRIRGPKIQLTKEAAELIKSVWAKRRNTDEQVKKKTNKTGNKDIPKASDKKSSLKEDPLHSKRDPLTTMIDDDFIDDDVYPGDYRMVLDHIAAGITRNADCTDSQVAAVTQLVAENLQLILSGTKPDDKTIMELIEKHLGETELMILRAMANDGDVSDTSSAAGQTPRSNCSSPCKYGSNKIHAPSAQNEDNGASGRANKLLDRLAMLKSMEVKDKKLQQEQLNQLKYMFKDGKVPKNLIVLKEKEKDKENSPHDEILAELLEKNEFSENTEFSLQKRRAVGGRYEQRIAKAKQHERKEINFDVNIDNLTGTRILTNKDGNETEQDDNYSSSFYSYSSHSDVSKATTEQSSKKTHQLPKPKPSVKKTSKSSFHRRKSRRRKSSVGSESHKSMKSPKSPEPDSLNILPNEYTPRRVVQASDSLHIVYDFDDLSDYDSDEEDRFLIPGNTEYTDSSYDALVDDLVTHFETMSTDCNEPIDKGELKKLMLRDTIENTKFSYEQTRAVNLTLIQNEDIGPVILQENDHYENQQDKFHNSELKNRPRRHSDDVRSAHTMDKRRHDEGVKSIHRVEKRRHSEDVKSTHKVKVSKERRTSIHSEENKNKKRNSVTDNGSSIRIRTKDNIEKYSGDTLDVPDSLHYKKDCRKSSIKKAMHVDTQEKSSVNLMRTVSPAQQDKTRRGSVMAGSTVTKHAVGETHFGMQLDALSNLPSVPNTQDMALRRRSIAPPPRARAMSISKSQAQAHHSRQIENPAMDFKNVPKMASEFKSTFPEMENEVFTEAEVPVPSKTTTSQHKQVILPMQKAQPSNAKMASVTQVNKPKPTRKMSKTLKVIRNDAPVKTLIGGDQHLFPGGTPPGDFPERRPPSSKRPLPPILKQTDDANQCSNFTPFAESVPQHEKPVATVKPLIVEKQTAPKSSHESVSPANSYYEFQEERSSHIIIPPSETISILSFTPSFSFSLFSLPNQYKQRNDMVKDYVHRVGKTQPKETSKTVINQIPTKDKTKGNKPVVVQKNKQVMNNLNKKVQKKVNDPNPIARYVKKLEPVKEEQSSNTQAAEQQPNISSQQGLTPSQTESLVYEEADSQTAFDIEVNSSNQLAPDQTEVHKEDKREVPSRELLNIQIPKRKNMSVYTSMQLESQMHLNHPTESIIIRVQDYT